MEWQGVQQTWESSEIHVKFVRMEWWGVQHTWESSEIRVKFCLESSSE
jgi:hypothetical protein